MFLGSVIYDKRRSLNLTQNDLADGVCNQNTISKMEKHNMTPQIDVLIKICNRLDISLNDVFSDFSSDVRQEQLFILDEIEEDVLLGNLTDIEGKLSIVKNEINAKDKVQFDLIQGLISFFKGQYEVSSFNFDKVIQETKSDNDNIYTLMSYLVKGMIYHKQGHLDMTQYYCQLVSEALTESLNISNARGVEILFLCKSLSEMYLALNQPELAIEFSKRGIKYANENHLSYFVAELNYSIALALKDDPDKQADFEKYKNIAYYCAMSTGNKGFQNIIENADE